MRVAIPHNLPQDEVRRRLRENIGDLQTYLPPGSKVQTVWQGEDRLGLSVTAMGQGIDGAIDVEERQVVFNITLPALLGFVEPMVEKAIRSGGTKLLEPPKG